MTYLLVSALCQPCVSPVSAQYPPNVCQRSTLCPPHVSTISAQCQPCVSPMSAQYPPNVSPMSGPCPKNYTCPTHVRQCLPNVRPTQRPPNISPICYLVHGQISNFFLMYVLRVRVQIPTHSTLKKMFWCSKLEANWAWPLQKIIDMYSFKCLKNLLHSFNCNFKVFNENTVLILKS